MLCSFEYQVVVQSADTAYNEVYLVDLHKFGFVTSGDDFEIVVL